MKKPVHKLLLALVAPALLLSSAQVFAADIKSRTFKFSHVQPKESHMGFGAEKFAELVAEKSGGKMKVRTFPNGTLGGDLQTVSALQGGTIELTTMPPGLLDALAAPAALTIAIARFADYSETPIFCKKEFQEI